MSVTIALWQDLGFSAYWAQGAGFVQKVIAKLAFETRIWATIGAAAADVREEVDFDFLELVHGTKFCRI